MVYTPYDWNQSPLIIPSRLTTQIGMLKSDENNNRAANPPGCVLSAIKRNSSSTRYFLSMTALDQIIQRYLKVISQQQN